MGHPTIVASIQAKADETERVRSERLKLIEITRAEKGRIRYDLHQDTENPAHLLFYRPGRAEASGSSI